MKQIFTNEMSRFTHALDTTPGSVSMTTQAPREIACSRHSGQ